MSRLTFDPQNHNVAPVWAPDGKHVIFAKRSTLGIVEKDASGVGEERLVYRAEGAINWVVPFGLSPDGATLVLGESANNAGIATVPLAGGKPAVFLGSPAVEGHAQLSPDGKWLAYQSDEGGRPQVFIRSYPDGRTKFQVSTTTDGLRPRWRADGRELYYAVAFGGQPLMAVSVEHGGQGLTLGRPQPLFSFSPPSVGHDTPFFPYAPAPDGKRFLIMRLAVGANVVARDAPVTVVLNWQAALR